MYKSPIETIIKDMQAHMDNEIMRAVQEVGINVDKGELIRALQYDRGQYEKGRADAREELITELAEKICASYEECEEGQCPAFAYCRHGCKGTLVWLRKVLGYD